jgi:hypothetical protein
MNIRRVFNSANCPASVDIGTQQIEGISVDNYSGYWLEVGTTGLSVPPYTAGWASNLIGGSVASGLVITKQVPGPLVTNPASGQNDTVIVTLYDTAISPSPGVIINLKPVLISTNIYTASVTNTYQETIIAGGAQLLGLAIEGLVTGGTVGEVNFQLTEIGGLGVSQRIAGIHVTTTPNSLYLNLNGITPAKLNPALPWRVQIMLLDRVGVNAFYVTYSLLYQE